MKMEMRNNLEKIIEAAKSFGAEQCDAILNTGSSFSLSAQNNAIEKYKLSGSAVIGIRAIKDNKVGISYTESMDDESLKLAAKNAVQNASFSDVNEFEKITMKSDTELEANSHYQQDTSTTQDKIDFCLRLESEVRKKDVRVQAVPYNGLTESQSATYYMNSHGTFGVDSEYYLSCYTSALLKDGTENSMHYEGGIARTLAELDLDRYVNLSLEHASQWLKAGPVKTGKYDIIFAPEQFMEVFNCFSNIFSAKAAWDKVNPFAQKLNQKVADTELTILDVPFYEDAFFRYDFDSEGVPRADLTLIENGVLQSFYHNSATANFFKTQNTGHASRGPRSSLGVAGTNRLIKAGKTSESDVQTGEYLEIHSLQGLHSGANSISGEFSFGASGYLCKNGERIKPIKGITIAGNYHQMLMQMRAIGDVIHSDESRSFFAPKIRFENLSVAGE